MQDAVNDHRAKLTDLASLLERIISNPTVIADLDFDRKLAEVQTRIDRLWIDAKTQSGGDKSISLQLEELKNRLQVIYKSSKVYFQNQTLIIIFYNGFNSKCNEWQVKLRCALKALDWLHNRVQEILHRLKRQSTEQEKC